jgi:hypothetical protein
MFERFFSKVTSVFGAVTQVARRRRERKLATAAEIERKERKVLVQALTEKLEAARLECEEKKQTATGVVLSLREIQFIEWNLAAWARHIKSSEIYAATQGR